MDLKLIIGAGVAAAGVVGAAIAAAVSGNKKEDESSNTPDQTELERLVQMKLLKQRKLLMHPPLLK